jgi:hypothetical protein
MRTTALSNFNILNQDNRTQHPVETLILITWDKHNNVVVWNHLMVYNNTLLQYKMYITIDNYYVLMVDVNDLIICV